MPLLENEIRDQAAQFLADLAGPVRLVVFTQADDCQYCIETRELTTEIAALSEQISIEPLDLIEDQACADELGIDKVPAIAVLGAQDYGVRFFGIPSGYEFSSFLHTIRVVAAGETELDAATLEALAGLDQPVHIQVFITPTCPYCPPAVMLAHQMAVASPLVRADMVEAMEFPDLSASYEVMGVPRTVINETTHIEGAVPPEVVMEKVRQALYGEQEPAEA